MHSAQQGVFEDEGREGKIRNLTLSQNLDGILQVWGPRRQARKQGSDLVIQQTLLAAHLLQGDMKRLPSAQERDAKATYPIWVLDRNKGSKQRRAGQSGAGKGSSSREGVLKACSVLDV